MYPILILLAQTTTTGVDMENIPQLVTMLTSVGFAVWYAYHLTTQVIPKMQEAAAHERITQQTQAAAERAEMKTAASKERQEMMDRFDKALDKVISHCKEDMALIVADNRQITTQHNIDHHP